MIPGRFYLICNAEIIYLFLKRAGLSSTGLNHGGGAVCDEGCVCGHNWCILSISWLKEMKNVVTVFSFQTECHCCCCSNRCYTYSIFTVLSSITLYSMFKHYYILYCITITVVCFGSYCCLFQNRARPHAYTLFILDQSDVTVANCIVQNSHVHLGVAAPAEYVYVFFLLLLWFLLVNFQRWWFDTDNMAALPVLAAYID